MNMQQKVEPPADMAKTLGIGTSPARRWLSARNIIVAVLVVAALAFSYFYFFSGSSSESVRYITQPAKLGGLTETVTATGTVEPTHQVEISSEQSGTVRQVLADYNDQVKAGQVLAVLDTAKLEAALSHARASLAVQQAQEEQAQATLSEAEQAQKRTNALTQKDFASQAAREQADADYQRAVAGLAVAKANVEVAQADVSTAETNLQKATITSPIKGVVLARDVDPGQTVAASLQAPVLFTIAEDLASMQLEVDIDEADVGQVHAGQDATFTVEAYRDRRFAAKVKEVRYASQTINNVVTYTAVLSLDNSDLLLRPGMTATADIVVTKVENAVLIPNAALRFTPPQTASTQATSRSSGTGLLRFIMPHRPHNNSEVAPAEAGPDGRRSVYVLENGVPKKVSIKTGATDGKWTEVVDGAVKAGTPLVTDSVTQ